MRLSKLRLVTLCILLVLLAAGCRKKPMQTAAAPPPPPPAAQPTATLTASPSSIERGQTTRLQWSTQNATSVRIEPELNTVSASGSRSAKPGQSTTYHLTAEGPGGTASASARVTVTATPVASYNPPPKPSERDLDSLWLESVKSIYFDLDKYTLREDQRGTLAADARFFQAHPNAQVTIEGYCDDRGSEEYNLGLGDRRANALREALVTMGVPADRIHTISYGKERPKCTQETDSCWQENRRGDFTHQK